ncbi:unnamed protein product [Ambrosiozyma monospora]|uniref:Unnamed protein product n=1 Tax=Ambrosiozyma monospora TaxID=43982 RepID=A0ACB5TNS2_AMBMO|nr:unnamed protein product [Ambrosiozyma monospora]
MTGYSFQSLNEADKEDWIYKINFAKKHWYWSKTMNRAKHVSNNVVFGIPIEFVCLREDSPLPTVIEKIMTEIEYRGLEEVGIYRKSASLSLMQQIKQEIDTLGDFNMENQLVFDVHNLTGCIKMYLRELPEPLIPDDHLGQFERIKELSQSEERFDVYHDIITKLPIFNYNLLERLIRHLKLIDEYKEFNKMSASNLATVLGGTFIEGCKPENFRRFFGLMNFICEDMIKNYEPIFEKELDQED